jgi:hypothetical protein
MLGGLRGICRYETWRFDEAFKVMRDDQEESICVIGVYYMTIIRTLRVENVLYTPHRIA